MSNPKMQKGMSLDGANERRAEITRDIQSIQAQLGDKQRSGDDGKRLSSDQYWSWRKVQQELLNGKLEELRQIKTVIRDQRSSVATEYYSAREHIQNLHSILVNLASEGVDMDEDEQERITAANDYLGRVR